MMPYTVGKNREKYQIGYRMVFDLRFFVYSSYSSEILFISCLCQDSQMLYDIRNSNKEPVCSDLFLRILHRGTDRAGFSCYRIFVCVPELHGIGRSSGTDAVEAHSVRLC